MPKAPPTHIIDEPYMLSARTVARRYNVTIRSIDRWLVNHIKFPQPDLITRDAAGRTAGRFWRLDTLLAWEETYKHHMIDAVKPVLAEIDAAERKAESARCRSEDDLDELEEETARRFGRLPPAACDFLRRRSSGSAASVEAL